MNLFAGYSAPGGITGSAEIKRLQRTLGVMPDGAWGPASEKAYNDYLKSFKEPMTAKYQVDGYTAPGMLRSQQDVKLMQQSLGKVKVDGIWGPETDRAYRGRMAYEAANPEQFATRWTSNGYDSERYMGGLTPASILDSAPAPIYTQSKKSPLPQQQMQEIIAQKLAAFQRDQPARPAPGYAANPGAASAAPTPALPRAAGSSVADEGGRVLSPQEKRAEEEAREIAAYQKRVEERRAAGERHRQEEREEKKRQRQEQEKREMRAQETSKAEGYTPFTLYSEKDFAVQNASGVLNYTTALENKESCCNLYSVVIDGKTHYFTGEVFVGKRHNVINPYLTDASAEKEIVFIDGLLDSKLIKYEGLIHSHPYSNRRNAFSGKMGDAAVATLSGDIYLTTADGNIYLLSRPDNLFEDVLSSGGTLLHSSLNGIESDPADTERYLDAWQALEDWYIDPPTNVYKEGLHTTITTNMREPNKGYLNEVIATIAELAPEFLLNAAIKRLYGIGGFYLYQKIRKSS